LHVSRLPQVRAAILDGTFHVFGCPGCGARARLEKLLAYTDFPRRHWMTVLPPDELLRWRAWQQFARRSFVAVTEERAAPVIRAMAPSFRPHLRIVFGLGALREKLLVFDAGLDDRVLELVKLELFVRAGLMLHPAAQLSFERSDGDSLLLAYRQEPQATPRIVSAPRRRYQQLAAEPLASRATLPDLFDGIFVDWRAALIPGDQPIPEPDRWAADLERG
jgi:hypothetical protein